MVELSTTTAIGYAVFDAELNVVACNDAYTQIVRMPRRKLIGQPFGKLFAAVEKPIEMFRRVLREGVTIRIHSFPYTFRHWARWEERYYDFSAHLLGEPGDSNALLLVRISEAAETEKPDIPSILRKLREQDMAPLFTGEDARGRLIDVYVHPAAAMRLDKLALIAVYRGTRQHVTIEIPKNALHRIALAAAAIVKS